MPESLDPVIRIRGWQRLSQEHAHARHCVPNVARITMFSRKIIKKHAYSPDTYELHFDMLTKCLFEAFTARFTALIQALIKIIGERNLLLVVPR